MATRLLYPLLDKLDRLCVLHGGNTTSNPVKTSIKSATGGDINN